MESQTYNYKVVRQFAIMTWSGVSSACWWASSSPAQLAFPTSSLGRHPVALLRRLRPLHTNAVIFAFAAPPGRDVLLRGAAHLPDRLFAGARLLHV